jgi:hypothetical protein
VVDQLIYLLVFQPFQTCSKLFQRMPVAALQVQDQFDHLYGTIFLIFLLELVVVHVLELQKLFLLMFQVLQMQMELLQGFSLECVGEELMMYF